MTVYRAVASGVFASGETWSFRQHFDSSAILATIAADWSAQINSAWTNGGFGLEAIYPSGTVLNLTSVAQLNGVPFREGAKTSTTEALPGTLGTDSLPEQTCIVISLRGVNVGKKNRGRIHLPAPAEDMATGGLLNSTPSTRVSSATDAIYGGMRTAGHSPVVYNVKVAKVPADDPVVQTLKVIVDQEVDRVLRTQRKRVAGRRAVYV